MCLLDCRVLTADRFLPPEPGGEDNGLGMSTGLRRELDANDFDEDVGVTAVGENSDGDFTGGGWMYPMFGFLPLPEGIACVYGGL